jgi:1-acyl-sn-glycerol-3-phosphate acyltransferase
VSVLNFSEGTTTTGETVLPMKRGVFGLARRLGVPISPARIDYDDHGLCWTGNAPFVPNALRLALHPSARMRVRFLPPISCKKNETSEELAERTRRTLEDAR